MRVVTFSQFSAVVEFKTNVNETLFWKPYQFNSVVQMHEFPTELLLGSPEP